MTGPTVSSRRNTILYCKNITSGEDVKILSNAIGMTKIVRAAIEAADLCNFNARV